MFLKMVFKKQRLQRPMHSMVMADKRMSRMTVSVCFINISRIRILYFRLNTRIFNFDFTTTIQYLFRFLCVIVLI